VLIAVACSPYPSLFAPIGFVLPLCHAANKTLIFQVAVVTVAFPATPLLLARARICISASHTREDLMKALDVSAVSCFFLA
jgi:hypothetical protein